MSTLSASLSFLSFFIFLATAALSWAFLLTPSSSCSSFARTSSLSSSLLPLARATSLSSLILSAISSMSAFSQSSTGSSLSSSGWAICFGSSNFFSSLDSCLVSGVYLLATLASSSYLDSSFSFYWSASCCWSFFLFFFFLTMVLFFCGSSSPSKSSALSTPSAMSLALLASWALFFSSYFLVIHLP